MSVASLLAPPRVRGREWLDDASLDPAIAIRSLEDVRRANALFGGAAAVLAELRALLPSLAGHARDVTLLDAGTGAGDIPAAARRLAATYGVSLRTFGLERTLPLAASARAACGVTVSADALRLPFTDRSVDLVTCSQLLHHFADRDAATLLRELHRVARHAVVVGEIRRSWFALAGIWLASWPLRFHPVSRHDGMVSVLRGFTSRELESVVHAATGTVPAVRRRPGFRVTATWHIA